MNKFHNLSISKSILLFITFIVFIVLISGGYITYRIFFGTTNEVVDTTSREINKQIIMNYENYIFDVIDVANFITETTLQHTKENSLDELQNEYETMKQVNPDIASITLLQLDGSLVMSSEYNRTLLSNLDDNEWFVNARSDSTIYHFSTPHREDMYAGGNHQVIVVSREIDYENDTGVTTGILVIELEVINFKELSEKTNLGENGHIVIVDENYNTVFTNNSVCVDSDCESIELMKNIILGGDFVSVDDIPMYVNVNTISLTRWRIATFINAEQVVVAKNTVILSLVVAFVIAFIITFFVSSMFSRRITSPIYKLNDYMKKFQKGSLESKITIDGQKELVELGDSFNEMIDEISELMNEVLVEQRAKRRTQFIALQNQINPHFLYNTLDSILWLNEQKRTEDVGLMIIALSKFFRTSISTQKNTIPLMEEIEHAKNYLLIQKIRYHNRFTYSFEMDDTLMDFEVLKLGLQPIVENAIYHGISPDSYDNHIVIRAYQKDEFVYLEVQNSGYGLSQEDIDQIISLLDNQESSKHIGLRNIQQRLVLYYGPSSRIEVVSELDQYTIVRMRFPIKRGEDL